MADSIVDLFSSGGSAASSAVTASSVLSAVSQAGTLMAVVGAVTGNRDLLKIGGTMGVIGGIGGYAVDTYNGSQATDAKSSTAWSGDTAEDAKPTSLPNVSTDQASNAAQGTMDTSSASTTPGLNIQPMNNPSAFSAMDNQSTTGSPSTLTATGTMAPVLDQGTTPAATGVQDVSAPSTVGVNTPAGVAGTVNNPSAWNGDTSQRVANDYLGQPKTDSTTWWNSITNVLKTSKPDTLLTLGGQILNGAAQGYTASQANQLNKDRLGILQQQMANGKSTASYNYSNKAK